jgi:RNA polymerase sigma-32 factor
MNTSLQRFDMALPLGSLEAYIQRVNQVPMLSQEEEFQLAERWHAYEDIEAARALIMSHLRYVVKIARGYAGYGLAQADLIQEGNVGLMKAVKRFNPNMGVRLVSFAVHWIKAEMHEFILRNWRIVKIATTKAQRKLFFNLRRIKGRLGWFSREEVAEVARDLGVSTKDVLKMEARLNMADMPFDGSTDEEDSHMSLPPAEYLQDNRYSPDNLEQEDWLEQGKQKLQVALAELDARSRTILERRWLADKKATLHELAADYKVSAERIRQLENTALKKIKEAIVC